MIEHCIEWGREKFNDLFSHSSAETVKIVDDPDKYVEECLAKETRLKALTAITETNTLLNIKDFAHCVQAGRNLFDDYFEHAILN